jgi:hypothetical protein
MGEVGRHLGAGKLVSRDVIPFGGEEGIETELGGTACGDVRVFERHWPNLPRHRQVGN